MDNVRYYIEIKFENRLSVKSSKVRDFSDNLDVNDKKQLDEMAESAKEILEVKTLDVLADKGYYNPEEIKKCVDNNIIPYIPEPKSKTPKEDSVPKAGFCDCDFKYDASRDVYICPKGCELTFSTVTTKKIK